jgi:hypothetical protein
VCRRQARDIHPDGPRVPRVRLGLLRERMNWLGTKKRKEKSLFWVGLLRV